MRRIAVLTSGQDAPGMNAAVRAVVRAADAAGLRIYGVRGGFAGLTEGRLETLDAGAVSGLGHLGGTRLGTGRSQRFRTTEGRHEALKHLDLAGVEGLVVVGGDGSLRGADALSRDGHVRVVGVPATIDNDVGGTDFSIGFDTAVNTALEATDRVPDNAGSHRRLFFVEVTGRHSGWLALYAALASGASAVLTPEQPADIGRVQQCARRAFAIGKTICLVVIAEGDDAGGAYDVAERVAEGLDVDARVVAVGPLQRGGAPSMRDRVLAAALGDAAVTALLDGADRVMVGEVAGRVGRAPLEQAWTQPHHPPNELLGLLDRLAR